MSIFEPADEKEVAERRKEWNKEMRREWLFELFKRDDVFINLDGTVNVQGSVTSQFSHNEKEEQLIIDQIPLKFNDVKGNFDCSNCGLTTLKNIPETIGGNFICSGNSGKFTEADIRKVCKVAGIVKV